MIFGEQHLRHLSYASIAEEGRPDSARRPERRTRPRLAYLGWASPSVRLGLNIRQGQEVADTIGREYYEHGAAPRIATAIERVG